MCASLLRQQCLAKHVKKFDLALICYVNRTSDECLTALCPRLQVITVTGAVGSGFVCYLIPVVNHFMLYFGSVTLICPTITHSNTVHRHVSTNPYNACCCRWARYSRQVAAGAVEDSAYDESRHGVATRWVFLYC